MFTVDLSVFADGHRPHGETANGPNRHAGGRERSRGNSLLGCRLFGCEHIVVFPGPQHVQDEGGFRNGNAVREVLLEQIVIRTQRVFPDADDGRLQRKYGIAGLARCIGPWDITGTCTNWVSPV